MGRDSLLGRITMMTLNSDLFRNVQKLEGSIDLTFEDFKRKKMDMSCIPGKIIGH